MTNFYNYNLLIEKYSEKILSCIKESKYTLIKGPTGCGKSTYIPLLLYDKDIRIAIIEPRRIAVTSLYNTISSVMERVGYRMRFNKKTKVDDIITIYTDGMFLNDGIDKHFDYVIIDEVHERSIRTDIILSLLQNTKSKVILMSATVETAKIQAFFNLTVFEIPGMSYSVEIIYNTEPVSDYLIEAYTIIKEICNNTRKKEEKINKTEKLIKNNNSLDWLEKPNFKKKKKKIVKKEINKLTNTNNLCFDESKGDILVFLTGENDINELERLLKKIPIVKTFKIYSGLSDIDQTKIYATCTIRKVILSTNICETSLTIPGIKYVIDCGLVKTKIYDGINYFGIVPISKESSDQRLGRCNRMGPGVCFRMYTEQSQYDMLPMVPEIMKSDLAKSFLQLIKRNTNIFTFNLLDYPPQSNVSRALDFLIKKNLITIDLKATKHGLRVLQYPFEMPLSCFYQDCIDNELGYYGSILVSLISIENYNFLHDGNFVQKDKESTKNTKQSDINFLINLFVDFLDSKDKVEFCKKREVSLNNLEKANRIFKNLNKCKTGNLDLLDRIFSSSFEYNLSIKEANGQYRHIDSNNIVYIHPSSKLFRSNYKKIVFVDVSYTTKEYTRIVGMYIKQD